MNQQKSLQNQEQSNSTEFNNECKTIIISSILNLLVLIQTFILNNNYYYINIMLFIIIIFYIIHSCMKKKVYKLYNFLILISITLVSIETIIELINPHQFDSSPNKIVLIHLIIIVINFIGIVKSFYPSILQNLLSLVLIYIIARLKYLLDLLNFSDIFLINKVLLIIFIILYNRKPFIFAILYV